jgi:hypothetical protein
MARDPTFYAPTFILPHETNPPSALSSLMLRRDHEVLTWPGVAIVGRLYPTHNGTARAER